MAIKEDEGLSESVKKGKFKTKIFFSDNVELSPKNLWKMISADLKQNILQTNKKEEIRIWVAVSYKFNIKSTFKTWNIM